MTLKRHFRPLPVLVLSLLVPVLSLGGQTPEAHSSSPPHNTFAAVSEQGVFRPSSDDGVLATIPARALHSSSACWDIVANGGFEFTTDWTMPVTPHPAAYSADLSHGGHHSVRTGILAGGSNVESYSSAYQTVTLPGEVGSATLSFWEYALSDEPHPLALSANINPLTTPAADDVQYALVLDEGGQWLRTLRWQASDERLWTLHQLDLSDYAGQTIRVHFGTYNDGVDGLTAMFVDDVSLEICPELPPTPTPTPTPELDRFVSLPLIVKHHGPPTATPGTVCDEMVANSNFEINAAWSMPITPMQAGYSTAFALSGLRSMRTGIPEGGGNIHSYSSAYQTIALPHGPGTATLAFWYCPVSGEAAATASARPADGGFSILDYKFPGFRLPTGLQRAPSSTQATDRQYAFLRDERGVWHLLLWMQSDARTWVRYEADISAYLGQTVRLHFETYNDGSGGTTAMYLDDASIEVCAPGSATATPTATPTPDLPYVLATIPLPADSHPHGLALDVNGNRIFVAHHGPSHDGHALSIINGSSLTVSTTIDLGSPAQGPNGVAYHRTSDRVYVANRNSDNVSVVDPTSGTVISHLSVGSMPNGVAVVGDLVYVANFADGTVTVIDAVTVAVSHTIPSVGPEPSHFAVDEAQGFAYLSLHGDGSVSYLRDGDRWNWCPGVAEAYGIAFDMTARKLYVGNRGFNHSVTMVEVDPNNVIGTFGVGNEPYMLGVNHNTGHLFVATTDSVQVRRTADTALVTVLPLPAGAEEGLVVDTARSRVYITSRDSDAVTVIQDM